LPVVVVAGVVQLAAEWVRQAWAVPPLAAERRRYASEAVPRPVRWAADRRDQTTRQAMERLERASQVGIPAAAAEMAPMRHRG
jgi:hypothetical protein